MKSSSFQPGFWWWLFRLPQFVTALRRFSSGSWAALEISRDGFRLESHEERNESIARLAEESGALAELRERAAQAMEPLKRDLVDRTRHETFEEIRLKDPGEN